RRNPTVNANGKVYTADYNADSLLWVDPVEHKVGEILMPTIGDKKEMRTTWPQAVNVPSPFYGSDLSLGSGVTGPHNPMMDQQGRVWVTSNIRLANQQPDYCKEGSDFAFAKYFPIAVAGKHVVIYDPKTGKSTPLNTCFATHHLQMAEDKDNTMFFASP